MEFKFAMDNRVKVGIRIRPLAPKEIDDGVDVAVKCENDRRVAIQIPSRQNKFEFDWAFNPNKSQSEVYNSLTAPLIESIFGGINATIFAYGQTGLFLSFCL